MYYNVVDLSFAEFSIKTPHHNMKKLIPIFALVPLVLLALTPPLDFALDCTINSTFWLWAVFASGFFTFLFLYQKVSSWLKLLVVWLFISCFLSRAPYISFTMFWSVIVCAYYYLLCTKIEDFTVVKKTIQAIFFFFVLLVIMQLFGKDTLLNFGQQPPDILHGSTTKVFGSIGNQMISASLFCILAPFLIFNPLNWILLILISFISWSSGAVVSLGAGLSVYAWARFKRMRLLIVIIAILAPILFAWGTGDFSKSTIRAGRLPVFIKTFQLCVERPFGYGIATYKVLFPHLCGKKIRIEQPGRTWNTSHNDWLQILFETGFIGMFLFIGWLVSIIRKINDPIKLAGVTIIAVNMMIHFPLRICQSAFIILMFLAFCSKGESLWE